MGGLVSGAFLLDWATLAGSLFNAILLLWLGLTVLLNAERRTWGTWLGGGALLLAAAFFLSHSAILGHGLLQAGALVDLWWRLAWVPILALPLAWYVIILWYTGYWDGPGTPLHRRHRLWLPVAAVLAAALGALVAFTAAVPAFSAITRLDLAIPNMPAAGGVPLLVVGYPVYSILCIGLTLDALRDPAPAARVMGDLARRRARPWLAATAVDLLLVSLVVAWAMIWIAVDAATRFSYGSRDLLYAIGWFDLAGVVLVGVAVVLVGQAIVSYEIFTGKTLPRGGFRRHWRSAILLAAGYSAVVAVSPIRGWDPVTALLLGTVLMTGFYALYHWRSYAERERYIEQLRPFMSGPDVTTGLLAPPDPGAPPPVADAAAPFGALCGGVLGAGTACLVPMGPLSALAGPPLVYPPGPAPPLPDLRAVAAHCSSAQTICLPLEPADGAGALWAVPLWSERGLIGMLLLGPKRDGGLYTQEEIEIARAGGERLIDTQASAEMARRLMALQRRRLAESQVLDQRTRRVLHDEVLPQLHAAMLMLGGAAPDAPGLALLAGVHRQIADLLRDLPAAPAPALARSGLLDALQTLVQDEFRDAFDAVTWDVAPEAAALAGSVPALSAEVLYYAAREMIRNAARHGRGGDRGRPLHLRVAVTAQNGLQIAIEDDGSGLAAPGGAGGSGQGPGAAQHAAGRRRRLAGDRQPARPLHARAPLAARPGLTAPRCYNGRAGPAAAAAPARAGGDAPMSNPEEYDALVLGAGQAGGPLASALGAAGKRTAIVEREHVGGTCINEGCTPTKTMVASARVAYLARRGSEYGVETGPVRVDMTRVRARKRAIVEDFRQGSERRLRNSPGVDLLDGEARFTGDHTVTVTLQDGGTRVLHAPWIFVNTGARPAHPGRARPRHAARADLDDDHGA